MKVHNRNKVRYTNNNIIDIDNVMRNKILDGGSYFNDNSQAAGRFANHFFRDLACSFIAGKNNTKFLYGPYKHKILRLGINLFEGEKNYNDVITLNDQTFFQYINEDKKLEKNFSLYSSYCQTDKFANYLYNFLNENENKKRIIEHNVYKERYNNNNDVFIHIRLGDVSHFQENNHNFEYFDNILQNLKFDKGYISSDSINHDICQKLINKYNLNIFNEEEVQTIMFGSTCKHIILSAGTFSWMIGIFGFFSQVYYKPIKHRWYSDEIFNIPTWNKIST